MKPTYHEHELFQSQLKHLIVELFRLAIPEPDKIPNDAPLLGGTLDLDSLDALELAICVEEKFGVTIQSRAESHDAFATINSLTAFIRRNREMYRQPNDAIQAPASASVESTFADRNYQEALTLQPVGNVG